MTRTPEEVVDDIEHDFSTTFGGALELVFERLIRELDKRYEVKE